ncbi:uncharacterized protein LOC121735366 [Aricia agestis]|uniref:uncharacterized protein LOC121735366 n=1 Tax=Aricia agestis TaxID=91739 RepID=UPI001C2065F0|nr:uncharacterized protein LOC121735366 [Aricia agestis]
MPYDITNPRIIIFLIENYEKENRLRLKWIEKNKKELLEAATLSREPKNYTQADVLAFKMESGLAALSRDHKSGAKNKIKLQKKDIDIIPGIKQLRHENTLSDVGLADSEDRHLKLDTSPDPIMRPVDPKVSKIIYKSKPEYGRDVYLKERSKLKPEDRYYFSECPNFDYGWRLRDSQVQNISLHGRRGHLTNEIRNRVGPQPDPNHYKTVTISSLHRCTDL